MVTVICIQGACIDEVELEEFSLAYILDEEDIKEIKEARAEGFECSAANVTVKDVNEQTIVTCFNYDGEAMFYIGTNFVGPKDI